MKAKVVDITHEILSDITKELDKDKNKIIELTEEQLMFKYKVGIVSAKKILRLLKLALLEMGIPCKLIKNRIIINYHDRDGRF